MVDFNKVLDELNWTRNKIIFFMSFLDAIVFFFGCYIALWLINLYPEYTFAYTIIYFFVVTIKRIRQKKVIDIEKRHPILSEELRTAADTIYTHNFMVEKLRHSIIRKLKKIPVSSFLDFNKVMIKIGVIAVLAFMLLTISAYNIRVFDVTTMSFNFGGRADGISYIEGGEVVKSSDKDINLRVLSNKLNQRALGQDKDNSNLFPSDAFEPPSYNFEERFSKKERRYIKEYFKNIPT